MHCFYLTLLCRTKHVSTLDRLLVKFNSLLEKVRFFYFLLNIVAHKTLCNRLWMRTSQWYFVLVLFCPITLLHRVLQVLDIEETTQVAKVLWYSYLFICITVSCILFVNCCLFLYIFSAGVNWSRCASFQNAGELPGSSVLLFGYIYTH